MIRLVFRLVSGLLSRLGSRLESRLVSRLGSRSEFPGSLGPVWGPFAIAFRQTPAPNRPQKPGTVKQ